MSEIRPVSKSGHIFALSNEAELFEFKIEDVLGHGGFGITYLASDTLLEELVAIKEYLPNDLAVRTADSSIRAKTAGEQADFENGLKSFIEEARLLARFRHPNIVHVRRFFEYHGTGYIVTEYVRGGTLSSHLSDGAIAPEILRNILDGVLDGLEQVHNRAILHRDLKPNNIILREDGQPVLIDFGAARDFRSRHSRSITAIATHGYSPPEQYGVGGQQGPWTDFYALGAIAYRAATGHPPPNSLRRLRNDPYVSARVAAPLIKDAALLDTIDWMLQLDESKRPATVQEVRDSLAKLPGAVAPPRSRAVAKSAADAARRLKPQQIFMIAASAVIAIGLGIFGYLSLNGPATRPGTEIGEKQLAAAKFDRTALENILSACTTEECSPDIKSKTEARLQVLKTEEDTFRGAGQDEAKLADYMRQCTACAYRTEAQTQIGQIKTAREDGEHQRLAQEEARKTEERQAEKLKKEQQEEARKQETARLLAEKRAAEKAKREQAEQERDRLAQEEARKKEAAQLLVQQQKLAAEQQKAAAQAKREQEAREQQAREREAKERERVAQEESRKEEARKEEARQEAARAEEQAAIERTRREQEERERVAQEAERNKTVMAQQVPAQPAPQATRSIANRADDDNQPDARGAAPSVRVASAGNDTVPGREANTGGSTYELAGLSPPRETLPPEAAVPQDVLIKEAQKELRRMRCYSGGETGTFSDDTKSALRRFIDEKNDGSARVPSAVTAELVDDLKRRRDGFCPPQCGSGEHLSNNRCVANAPARRREREVEHRERPAKPTRAAAAPAAERPQAATPARSSGATTIIGVGQ